MADIVQVLVIIGIIIFAVVKQIAGSSEEKKKQRHPQANQPPFLSHEYDLYHAPTETAEQSPPGRPAQKTDPSPPTREKCDENPEFNIQSAEEVRRGIIWSEILHRKY